MIILKNAYYMLLMAIFTFGLLTFPREVNAAPAVYFTSFRDVPGVTEEEIIAIELLIEQHDYFIYGMLKNDEAFYTINGEITGFAARMTGWLTELFGIPFIPAIFEWTELIDGLESGEIDFTGQLTRTEERTLIYTMTDPIAKRTLDTVRVKDA
ncbi:MAG: transporter substrate-binding domain-containing protein, partial [Defluviitaleaceae bacterium]|nr:transporter substrate-binding domain-containing protein [Defluviitaleaceae bacterium]